MKISIIIVNYNTKYITKNTIDSVLNKTKGIDYEIIIVDNASTDGSVEYLRNNYLQENKQIKILENTMNLGFGKANNKGVEIAKGKYFFFLNPDTLLLDNCIKTMYDFMEKNTNVAVCGGNLYTKDLTPNYSCQKRLYNNLSEFSFIKRGIYKYILRKEPGFNYSKQEQEVDYISGANIFVRAKVFNEIGRFDSDFFMYFEETELLARIKKRGYKIVSLPNVKIIHLEGQSNKIKEIKLEYFFESKYKYFYKVYSLKSCKINYLISQLKYVFFLSESCRLKFKINKKKYMEFIKRIKDE